MTRLSVLSNVRLDEFVYTLDCLRAARARLTDDGGLALYFSVHETFIDWRLLGMMTEVFGRYRSRAPSTTACSTGSTWRGRPSPTASSTSGARRRRRC